MLGPIVKIAMSHNQESKALYSYCSICCRRQEHMIDMCGPESMLGNAFVCCSPFYPFSLLYRKIRKILYVPGKEVDSTCSGRLEWVARVAVCSSGVVLGNVR